MMQTTPLGKLVHQLSPLLGNKRAERLIHNFPSHKPQLWQQFLRAFRARITERISTKLNPNWPTEPHITTLADLNIRMEVVPHNYFIDGFIYTFGVYEVSGTWFIKTLLSPNMTVFDVGANSGYYSLIASEKVGSNGHVHSFEPAPALINKLQRNLSLNPHLAKRITVYTQAVGDHKGQAEIFLASPGVNDGLGSMIHRDGLQDKPISVPLTTLDDLWTTLQCQPVHLLKIDVEGAEHLVFKGASSLLSSDNPPVILFETYDPQSIIGLLESYGYKIKVLHCSLHNGLEFYDPGESYLNNFDYEGQNYVAIKPSSNSPSFQDLTTASKQAISPLLQTLAQLA